MSSLPDNLRPDRVIRRPTRTVPMSPLAPAPQVLAPTPSASATSIDVVVEAARREAFEEGRRAGAAEVRSSVETARAAMARRTAMQLEEASRQVAALRAQVVDEVVNDLSALVVDLAEVLVGRELAIGASAAREAIARALALAPSGPELVVSVHPDCGLEDQDIVGAAVGRQVTILRDPSIDLHGCRIMAGGCQIDSQIPAALERVRAAVDALRPVLAATNGNGNGNGNDGACNGNDGAGNGHVQAFGGPLAQESGS
jgi:flagellar biosynthesis/type III secretory pathway protein FliH